MLHLSVVFLWAIRISFDVDSFVFEAFFYYANSP